MFQYVPLKTVFISTKASLQKEKISVPSALRPFQKSSLRSFVMRGSQVQILLPAPRFKTFESLWWPI